MHALVTGASSGIGHAVARALAHRGYALTLVSRTRGEAGALLDLHPETARFVDHDLSDLDGLGALLDSVEAGHGPVDVLVNNAGASMVGATARIDPDAAQRLMTLDLLAPLALTRAVLPGMITRGRGTVVDVSSVNAFVPTPGAYHYNAAKAGLAAASESLRVELAGTGVHVMTVYPGPIDTPLLARASQAMGLGVPAFVTGRPEVLAEKIARGIERRRPRVVYPSAFGVTRALPSWLIERFLPNPPSSPSSAPANVRTARGRLSADQP